MERLSTNDAAFRCNSCRSGHDVHFIQAKLSWEDKENPRIPGTLLEVHDDGAFLVEDDHGNRHRLWNHDPERLQRLAIEAGSSVCLHLRWQLLKIATPEGGYYCFCVCPPEERTPCGRRTLPGAKQHSQYVKLPPNFANLSPVGKDEAVKTMVHSVMEGLLDQLNTSDLH